MKFIPILFSTPMVQAILDGSKTQTRRVIKSRHESGLFQISRRVTDGQITSINSLDWDERNCEKDIVCPYGQEGDILWVRENWSPKYVKGRYPEFRIYYPKEHAFIYKASDLKEYPHGYAANGWKPSIHMPKEAARIFLKVTNVRVERLQDISEEDAISEGITYPAGFSVEEDFPSLIFSELWESINGLGSWNDNPWVWVIEFERIEKPENFIYCHDRSKNYK